MHRIEICIFKIVSKRKIIATFLIKMFAAIYKCVTSEPQLGLGRLPNPFNPFINSGNLGVSLGFINFLDKKNKNYWKREKLSENG